VLLYGGNGDDFLSGFGYGNFLDSTVSVSIGGDDGDDRIFGSHKQDFLNGGRGNDTFRTEGDPGNQDLLVGGAGFDNGILDADDNTDGAIESVGISG
jgi:Ca2+-binding RTX toxin-like protein